MVAVFVWFFLAGPTGWRVLLADGDTGWHIRTGEWIFAHGHVPTQDLFSFSKAGAPWFAWEWLSDVLFAWLFHAAGFKALLLFTGIVIAAFSGVILRFAIWRGANPHGRRGLAVLADGRGFHHAFSGAAACLHFALSALSIWLIEADRRRASSRIWLLVPLTLLWTNLHGGWAILIACLVLLVSGLRRRRPGWACAAGIRFGATAL